MFKKILVFVGLLLLVSCVRKPLYLRKDCVVDVGVTVETSAETFWNKTWRDSLVYKWDEKKYGPIGYSEPEDITVLFFNGGEIETEMALHSGGRKSVQLDFDKNYKVLFFNKTMTTVNYLDGDYYVETPSTETRGYIDEKYETVFQPGEVFSLYLNNLYLSEDYGDYEVVYENGKTVYIYNIDATIKPVSYIYIVQFIIINDDGADIEAKMINNFTVSGISAKKSLFTEKSLYTGRKQISTFDIKEPQIMPDSIVFASRITVLDLLPEREEGLAWDEYINHLYYTSIDVQTYSYGIVSGTKDITEQIKENPKGGVITVRIMNSELKAGGESGEGFGISLGEWKEHLIDVE